jgi:CDP-diacylglycerol--glycerol-3-phosphate 3-phosphatidyltransferase
VPFNTANLITACRIALAPVLLLVAWQGRERLFLALLIVSLVSDIVDGQIARRLNLATELGARLDSWADFLTYMSVPLAIWWLRPDVVATEKIAFFAVVASYAVPIAVGFAKFRGLTSYHTLMVRVASYLLGAAVLVMLAHGPTLPLRVAVAVLVLAELEEICITLVLPQPRTNVRSIAKAIELRRAMTA